MDYPLWTVFAVSLAALFAASEAGHFLGERSSREANIATLEASVLGLLALMLSFTFAMALTRFDARRDAVLIEANAIGTAALRAGLLPAPHGAASLKLFQEYVQIRLDITTRVPTPTEMNIAIARSNDVQKALWFEARAAMAKDNAMVPMGLYIMALNETFDNQERRLTAFRTRVPGVVLLGLYGIAVVAIGFAGYASGLEKRPWRLPVYTITVLVAAVMLLIQDIDRPSSGFVAVSQQPMLDTADAIASYTADLLKIAPRR